MDEVGGMLNLGLLKRLKSLYDEIGPPPGWEAERRAQKGLAWLRESGSVHGLDVDQVDIDQLDIRNTCRCVLGQLNQDGGYSHQVYSLSKAGALPQDEAEWLHEHGFEADAHATYEELTAAWRKVLKADRAAQSQEK